MLSVFLFSVLIASVISLDELSPLWRKILTVNETCPKFVVVKPIDFGLGDSLNRVFSGISIALESGATLAFSHVFWRFSTHDSGGYENVLVKDLGLPVTKVIIASYAAKKYKSTILRSVIYPDSALFNPAIVARLPCRSIAYIADYSQCTDNRQKFSWCSSYIGSAIQSVIRPVLDESRGNIYLPDYKQPLLRDDFVNVVWHIRTGDICLHCKNSSDYERLGAFFSESAGKYPLRHIVVHLSDSNVPVLFKSFNNTVFYTENNASAAVRLFMKSDILVTTGSSFPNAVALLTGLHRPLVFQSLDKDATVEYHESYHNPDPVRASQVREKYSIVEGRAIRLDESWNPIGYSREAVKFILKCQDVFDRIDKATKTGNARRYRRALR